MAATHRPTNTGWRKKSASSWNHRTIGNSANPAPAGDGMPMKNERCQGGCVDILGNRVEPRQPQRAADAEQQHQPPADAAGGVERPEVEGHRRRDAEAQEVGQRIQLGAELRRAFEDAGDAAVEAVEHAGDDDGENRRFPPLLQGEAERRQSAGERQERQRVRDHPVDVQAAQPLAGDVHRTEAGRGGSLARASAMTVSPPIIFWPTATSGTIPSGR